MKEKILIVGAIFAVTGGLTASVIKTIKNKKTEDSREEQSL